MHALVDVRIGSEPCNKIRDIAMDEFAEKSNLGGFPKKPKLGLEDGMRNNICYNGGRKIYASCGKGDLFAPPQERETTAPTNLEGSTCHADENLGISNVADKHHASQFSNAETILTLDEHKNKGKELFYCDWPDLGDFEDFETMFRNSGSAFEQGSNYAEELSWSSVSSPDISAHHVPGSCLFAESNPATVVNEKPTGPVLRSYMPVADVNSRAKTTFQEQISMISPMDIRQPSDQIGRDRPLLCATDVCSSSKKNRQFSQHPGPDHLSLLSDMTNTKTISSCGGLEAILSSNQDLLPTTSSIMCDDDIVSSSSCIEPDLIATHVPQSLKKLHGPFGKTPDMILEEMSEKPLQEQFLPAFPSTNHQSELLMNATSTQKQKHRFPEDFRSENALNCSGSPFYSMGMASNSCTSFVLEAVPVKVLGFQKLQESMNQLDVRTKMCIRDALYRLANCVEQRHTVAQRFTSSKPTELQTNPMDRSVVQLLFHKT